MFYWAYFLPRLFMPRAVTGVNESNLGVKGLEISDRVFSETEYFRI